MDKPKGRGRAPILTKMPADNLVVRSHDFLLALLIDSDSASDGSCLRYTEFEGEARRIALNTLNDLLGRARLREGKIKLSEQNHCSRHAGDAGVGRRGKIPIRCFRVRFGSGHNRRYFSPIIAQVLENPDIMKDPEMWRRNLEDFDFERAEEQIEQAQASLREQRKREVTEANEFWKQFSPSLREKYGRKKNGET